MTAIDPVARLRRAMEQNKSDSLERAERAFGGMSDENLDKQYGQSGKTCREVLDRYRADRHEWQVANDMLESFIASLPER